MDKLLKYSLIEKIMATNNEKNFESSEESPL